MSVPVEGISPQSTLDPIDVRIIGGSASKDLASDFGSFKSFTTFAGNTQGPQQILPVDRARSKSRVLIQAGNGNTIPAPTVTPITLGANGVAAYNNNSVGVNANVSGGTVTQIAINGTNTNLTSGNFFVPAGGTITITYSVAPTLTTTGIATSGTPSNAFVLLGSRGQVQNNQGGQYLVGNSVSIENGQEVWMTGDGTNSLIVTVLAERYAVES